FEDLFPANHPNVKLYQKYRFHYGGAQTLVLLLRVRHGDVFNFRSLRKILDLQNAVNRLPAVDHNQVFSLASYRVAYAEAEPGGLTTKCFMYPQLPATQQELEDLKHLVHSHRDRIAGLITPDDRGALVTAAFNADRIDYGELFNDIQALV